jgi:short-subunit dehydrogenase
MSFNNKHVVVTGGAGGIGGLMCQTFVEQGASVTVIDRVDSIEQNEKISLLQADLSSMEGIQETCEALAELEVEVLVNLAGLQYFGLFEEQSPAQVLQLYMVNLVAPVMLTQAVLPSMKRRGSGHVVNIGSIFGSINFAHFVTYSSSKAGMKGFSEALRREVAKDGIKVTYVAPRAVKTALNDKKVMQLAKATRMNMDNPDYVVGRIMQAISSQKKEVYIGFPECLFVRVNALLPRVVDQALAADDKKARTILNQAETV